MPCNNFFGSFLSVSDIKNEFKKEMNAANEFAKKMLAEKHDVSEIAWAIIEQFNITDTDLARIMHSADGLNMNTAHIGVILYYHLDLSKAEVDEIIKSLPKKETE